MSLGNRLRAGLFRFLTSDRVQAARHSLAEKRRRLGGDPHRVSVFLELDDPYSYLLSGYLPEFAAAYDIELEYLLAQANYDEAYRPYPDMLARYAEQDCKRLATELGVPFLDRGKAPPVEHRRALVEVLAEAADGPDFAGELCDAIALYWRGDTEGIARRVAGVTLAGKGEALLAKNGKQLKDAGHYNCAMLNYEGEWYWGIDRLHYLAERLDELGARHEGAPVARLAAIRRAMQLDLPVAKPDAAKNLPPLELFVSFRSPYSYLGLRQVFEFSDAFGLQLLIRPVLPMVMRGMKMPRQKLAYIAQDTRREASRLEIAFGNFADPVGVGVERCMAVFCYAQSERREREFLLRAGEAIWARKIDVATDKGMREITHRCGLFWPDVAAAMDSDDWRQMAEENRESMMETGCWGVPALRLGKFVVWGQDRIWLLARHVEELCDAGEGILV